MTYYPKTAEYGQVRKNGWPVASFVTLDAKRGTKFPGREYRFNEIGAGYEIAGSAMRWTDHVYSASVMIDGARHGRRFRYYDKARDDYSARS